MAGERMRREGRRIGLGAALALGLAAGSSKLLTVLFGEIGGGQERGDWEGLTWHLQRERSGGAGPLPAQPVSGGRR